MATHSTVHRYTIPIHSARPKGAPRYEFYAPKIRRRVTLFTPLQVRFWTLLESAPLVHSYCERPAYWEAVEGRRLTDFWVKAGPREACCILADDVRPGRVGTLSSLNMNFGLPNNYTVAVKPHSFKDRSERVISLSKLSARFFPFSLSTPTSWRPAHATVRAWICRSPPVALCASTPPPQRRRLATGCREQASLARSLSRDLRHLLAPHCPGARNLPVGVSQAQPHQCLSILERFDRKRSINPNLFDRP